MMRNGRHNNVTDSYYLLPNLKPVVRGKPPNTFITLCVQIISMVFQTMLTFRQSDLAALSFISFMQQASRTPLLSRSTRLPMQPPASKDFLAFHFLCPPQGLLFRPNSTTLYLTGDFVPPAQ